MNEKMVLPHQDRSQPGPEAPPAPVTVLILFIAVFMLALAGLLRLLQLHGGSDALSPPVAALAAVGENAFLWQTAPGDEYAFYTERYWHMAAARETSLAAHPQASGSGYASYTGQYWQAAAAREARLSATSAAPGAPTLTLYASYTDRYWQMAADREARLKLASSAQ
jgi:hypothetical protein